MTERTMKSKIGKTLLNVSFLIKTISIVLLLQYVYFFDIQLFSNINDVQDCLKRGDNGSVGHIIHLKTVYSALRFD